MKKRKCRLITACLLSATLTSSMLCSSIVLASEVPDVPTETQEEKPETDIQQDDGTNEVNNENVSEPQIKARAYTNQEADGIETYADEGNNAGDFNVTGDTGFTYDKDANTLTFTASGEYTVTGNGVTTTERIIVLGSNITAKITLNNVNIDVSNNSEQHAFYAKNDKQTSVHLTIVLQEINFLKSGQSGAGLTWNNTDDNSTLEIKGEGSLTATGGRSGAGVGGGNQASGNNITITSGTIIATGGVDAAGIGGGLYATESNITINGGKITATSSYFGAGIGGGYMASGNNITINGGTVTATGGMSGGTGIGGGNSGNGSNITISGGTVTATGTSGVAGIGSANPYISAKNIKITDGSVKASSIGTIPTDDSGTNNVYLAKLNGLSGVDSVTVDTTLTYTRNGNHSDDEGTFNDGAFYLYLTGENHEIVTTNGTYIAKWNGSDSFSVQQPTPTPTFTTTSTAQSITVNPINHDSAYGTIQYKWDDGDWGTNDTLSNLNPSTSHTVSVRYAENDNYQLSAEATQNPSTNSVSYKISIPATTPLVAGNTDSTATISIDSSQSFDLGFNGQVDVKIAKNGKVTDDAKLNLTRTNDTETVITSALLVGGNPLGDITKSVATFRASTDTPVSISFAKPTEENIPAGTYNGTITFEVSYSEPTTP